MADNAIVLTEGDEVTYTVTVKRSGSAVNLTGKTVKLYAHDGNAAKGTNQINGLSGTVTDAANGVCTFAITSTHTTISGSDSNIDGKWAVLVNTTSGDLDEWTKQEPFAIIRNPFIA